MPTPPEFQSLDLSQNIRDDITNLDDDALRASLKEFGWKKHLPAFTDENNVVLVGHRRMRLAADLGIEPVIVKLELGSGSAADAERRIIATTANVGFAEMSIASRRKLAVEFCQQGMTQAATAALLGVSQNTISRDIAALSTVDNAPRPVIDKLGRKNTGRRGSGTKANKSTTATKPADKPRAETAPRAADDGARSAAAPPSAHELVEARQEIDRLRKQLAAAIKSLSSVDLIRTQAENARLHNQIRMLSAELAAKSNHVKPPRPPLDPESAAAREIKALKTRVNTLTRQLENKDHRATMALAADAPFTLRGKMAKALSEQHTSPEARLAALQAWNGLGANNGSKTARRAQKSKHDCTEH